MPMKSQGLPINFIVLAAIAILVLIVVLMFFVSGFRTEAVTTQAAVTACDSRCLSEFQRARGTASPYNDTSSKFCAISQNVKGIGTNLQCDELTSCQVKTSNDVTCTIKCGTTTNTTSCCSTATC